MTKFIANFVTFIAVSGLFYSASTALAQTVAANDTRASAAIAAHTELSAPRLSGSGKLSILGFDIYAAKLWVGAGFTPAQYTQHPFALELTYLRNFKGSAIAERSIKEMRKLAPISDAQAQAWLEDLTRALPDVKPGDQLTGVFRPGRGMRLRQGDKILADWADPTMAALFMGIWLSPQSADPSLRAALLAGSPP